MTPLYFHAAFMPNSNQFRVEVKFQSQSERPAERYIEFMNTVQFMLWTKGLSADPIKIGGKQLQFHGGANERQQVVEYFQSVADTYKQNL